jgi:hypothetical protein
MALQLIVWDASGRPIWDASGHPSSLPGRTTDLTAVGLWEQVDERTGRTQSWFKITERGGVYEGTLVQVSPTCEGAGACFLGLTLIKGMRRNGNSYDNGTITDPRLWLPLQCADAPQSRQAKAGSARLSRHFAVRSQPDLDSAAG